MKRPEITDELKMDLKALKMRSLIYKKRFYKSNDTNALPIFFQMGQVVTTGNEMGDERLKRKDRKANMAEQFLCDDDKQGMTDVKFTDITTTRRRLGEKKRFFKNVTKNKKNKNR
jgi:hypothetical protein